MNKFSAIFFVLVLFLIGASTSGAYAQAKKAGTKTVELQGKTVAKSRGANPNIKSEMPTTDKAVPQSRGALCGIHFDNRTGLTIKIYVDGDFYGVVGPYGDEYVSVGDGYTTIYCVSAGGTREWAASGGCSEGYVYTLR